MEEKTRRFTLKTVNGSWRMLALFMVLILLFSFFANLIISRGYKIDMSDITYDVRGAELSMELYKPTGVDSSYRLPCVIIVHGGSENLSATSLVSWEFAKRGFVVLAVSMYGAALSGQPAISEEGRTAENYDRVGTQGVYDALQYARSLTYVDKTRIGLWGHSAGYSAVSDTLILDGDCLTMNDRMLNVLYNNFGVKITEDQLTKNADDIAASQLSKGQLETYEYLKTEQQKIYDNYVKSARFIEDDFDEDANIAGFKVKRNPQVNIMLGEGTHESSGSYTLGTTDIYKKFFHTGNQDVVRNGWYDLKDNTVDPNATSTLIGECYDISSTTSSEMKNAIANRSARMFYSPETFHNGNLWDYRAISETLEFFTQTLGYNNGNLSDSATQPINVKDLTSGYIALACTTLSFISMIGMLIALASILLKSKFFSRCATATYEARLTTRNKKYYIAAAFALIAGFAGTYLSSEENISFDWSNSTPMKWLPWEPGQMRTIEMVGGTALVGLVLFLIFAIINRKKKDNGFPALSDINIKFGWIPVLKTALMCVILFAACYITAAFIKGAFHTRFLFIDGSFELMKSYGFARLLKYAVILLPFTLIISSLNNLTTLKNVRDGADTAINVIVTSLGAELLLVIGLILTYSTPDHLVVFHLHAILSLIVLVPVMNYLFRKMYKMTGSVWAGAIIVAIILGWRLSSYVSHQFIYWGPNPVSAFWGIY